MEDGAGLAFGIVFSVLIVVSLLIIAANVNGIRRMVQGLLFPREGPQVVRACPHCRLQINAEATVCPFCHRESAPWRQVDGVWRRIAEGGTEEYFDDASRSWRHASGP